MSTPTSRAPNLWWDSLSPELRDYLLAQRLNPLFAQLLAALPPVPSPARQWLSPADLSADPDESFRKHAYASGAHHRQQFLIDLLTGKPHNG